MNLKTFLKGHSNHEKKLPGCCNYMDGFCIDDEPCDVLEGERCTYFERAVLPTANESRNYPIIELYNKLRKAPETPQDRRSPDI